MPAAPASRRNDTSAETRQRIMLGALRHFATMGLHGASVREISQSSAVPLSALHYHFGSKDNLFIETIEHFFSQLAAERLARLEAARAEQGRLTTEGIVRAFIEPILVLAASEDGLDYVRLQLRPFEDDGVAARIASATAPTSLPFLAALAEALPGVPRRKLVRAYRQMVWGITHGLVDPIYERLTDSPAMPAANELAEVLEDFVTFYAAGFAALSRRP